MEEIIKTTLTAAIMTVRLADPSRKAFCIGYAYAIAQEHEMNSDPGIQARVKCILDLAAPYLKGD